MSVLIAALMSGLDSMFNSTSAIFVVDVWTRIRKKASVREQMVVGRYVLKQLFQIMFSNLMYYNRSAHVGSERHGYGIRIILYLLITLIFWCVHGHLPNLGRVAL